MREPEDDPRIKMLLQQAEAASGPDYPNHKRGIICGLAAGVLGGVAGGFFAFIAGALLRWSPSTSASVLIGAGVFVLFGYLFGALRPPAS